MTAVDTLGPTQAAFYARMIGDATLLAKLGQKTVPSGKPPMDGVYDGAPEGAPYPLIDLGEAVETPRNALAQLGSEVVVTLHVWLQGDGYAAGHAIVNDLKRLFDHQPLVIAGHAVVSVRHEQTLTLRDPNPKLRHLPVRFRLTTEQE